MITDNSGTLFVSGWKLKVENSSNILHPLFPPLLTALAEGPRDEVLLFSLNSQHLVFNTAKNIKCQHSMTIKKKELATCP
jgi:hypothetical protein